MGILSRRTLKNGIRHMHEHAPGSTRFYLTALSRMGSEKEYGRERGAQHYWEHNCFREISLKRTLRQNEYIENLGIDRNGETSATLTSIQLYGPASIAEELVDIAYDTLHHPVGSAEHERERNPIRLELNLMQADLLWYLTHEELQRKFYGSSPYGATIQDDLDNLSRLTVEASAAAGSRVFRSSNMSVVTIGDYDFDTVTRWVGRRFGKLPKAPDLKPPHYSFPKRKRVLSVMNVKGLPMAYIYHTLRCGEPTLENTARMHVLASVLTRGFTGILYKKLRIVRGRSYAPAVSLYIGRPENRLSISYPCDSEEAKEVAGKVDKVFGRLAFGCLREDDFQRYQRLAMFHFDKEMDDEIARSNWYALNEALYARKDGSDAALTIEDFKAAICKVTRFDLRSAVREWRGENRMGTGTVVLQPEGTLADIVTRVHNPHNIYK